MVELEKLAEKTLEMYARSDIGMPVIHIYARCPKCGATRLLILPFIGELDTLRAAFDAGAVRELLAKVVRGGRCRCGSIPLYEALVFASRADAREIPKGMEGLPYGVLRERIEPVDVVICSAVNHEDNRLMLTLKEGKVERGGPSYTRFTLPLGFGAFLRKLSRLGRENLGDGTGGRKGDRK